MSDVLVLVPARGGSTRVANKNIKRLGGKPLLGHTVSRARESGVGRVVVSTNDETIAEHARAYGAETPFLRPEEMSGAKAASLWVILHALSWFRENEGWEPEFVAFCPPTNPFLKASTLSDMLAKLRKSPHLNSMVTVQQPKTHPFRIVREGADGRLMVGVVSIDGKTILDVERSQDWPEVWEGSPACRMTRAKYFYSILESCDGITSTAGRTYDADNCGGVIIDALQGMDIDDEDDWAQAELLVATGKVDG